MLGCVGREKEILQTASQWVNFSLKVWAVVVKRFQLQQETKLLRRPAYDPEFTPALHDFRFREWVYSGITFTCKTVK